MIQHYHLEVQANPKKMAQKLMFLASMEETRLFHEVFIKSSLGPLEVVEVE